MVTDVSIIFVNKLIPEVEKYGCRIINENTKRTQFKDKRFKSD